MLLRALTKWIKPLSSGLSHQKAQRIITKELRMVASRSSKSGGLLIDVIQKSVRIVGNVVHVGKSAVSDFVKHIFNGNFISALKQLGLAAKPGDAFVKYLSKQRMLDTSFRLSRADEISKNLKTHFPEFEALSKIKAGSREEADLLKNINLNVTTPKTKNWLTLKNSLLAAGLSLGAGGLVALVQAYQTNLSGCIKHYVNQTTGKYEMCRITNASCNFKPPSAVNFVGISECEPALLHPTVRQANCLGVSAGASSQCVHCFSEQGDPALTPEINDDDGVFTVGEENVIYKCHQPTFLQAFSMLLAQKADGVLSDLEKLKKKSESLMSQIYEAIKFAIPIVVVLATILGYSYIYFTYYKETVAAATEEL
ncbi:per os infectivity factor pif-5 [Cotesia congregata filamentous virus 1]|uniref:Per os infectivity factor pif-5 n=1 Tax=Cotesia congregata filamentous virus 1 TaxID=3064291 RepID=A0ABC8QS60_9VIRU|nr:per os infectivity factor pif-5 [Cotesia congregata filamentous virus 1]